jgi:hypothetical protein
MAKRSDSQTLADRAHNKILGTTASGAADSGTRAVADAIGKSVAAAVGRNAGRDVSGQARDAAGRFTAAGAAAESASRSVQALTYASEKFGNVAGRATSAAAEGLGRIASTALNVATRVAEIGVAAGLALAVHGVLGLNQELEQTQISLGAVFQAQGYYKTFEDGFARSGREVAAMRKEVMKLPGTFNELAEIMTTIASPAAATGMSIDQMRKLAEQTMLTAAILKVPQDMAAREMAMLLGGRAGAHNVLGTRLGLVGSEAQKFNKEDPAKRFQDLEERLNRYSGAADRFSTSFKANATTMKDNLMAFEQLATKPLFDAVNRSLSRANAYIDSHHERLTLIADLVGNRISGYWERIESAFVRIEPLAARIAKHIANVSGQDLADGVKKAAEIALALKLAPTALSLAAQGAVSAGSSIGGALGAVGALPVTIMAVAAGAVAAFAAFGEAHALADTSSPYHADAVRAAKTMGDGLSELGEAVKPTIGLFDKLGVSLTEFTGNLLRGFSQFTQGWRALPSRFRGEQAPDRSEYLPADMGLGAPASVGLSRIGEAGNQGFWDNLGKIAVKELTPRKAPITNIGTVNITVKGSDDPARVARLTMDHLERIARNPKQSPFIPDYSSPRS